MTETDRYFLTLKRNPTGMVVQEGEPPSEELVLSMIPFLPGSPGPGVPGGGVDGQIIAKDGSIPFATKWVDNVGGSGDVQTVNNVAPDVSGNVQLTAGDIGAQPAGDYLVNTATGAYSIATGAGSSAAFERGSIFGLGAEAQAQDATAMGFESVAGYSGSALGSGASSAGTGSVAVGFESTANNAYTTAVGDHASAAAYSATAVGKSATASGVGTVSIGISASATAENAIAIGANASSEIAGSVSIGPNSATDKTGQVSFGTPTNPNFASNIRAGEDPLDGINLQQMTDYVSQAIDDFIATADPLPQYILASTIGQANGVADLGGDGKIPLARIPSSIVGQIEYQSSWDASSGTPPSVSPEKGHYWIVSVTGTTALSGISDWVVGDWAIYSGTEWQKIDNTDAVSLVAGLSGVITAEALKTALAIDLVNNVSAADLRDRSTHTGTQSADTITNGSSNKVFTTAEQSKLAGIASGATANDTDANLKNRENHTGTQSADSITDGTINKAFLATERTKLAGIATGATANDTDSNLKARANHTGTQLASTISDFSEASQDIVGAMIVSGGGDYDDPSGTITFPFGITNEARNSAIN